MKKAIFFISLLFSLAFPVFGQTTITGTVFDKSGETLPGVTVSVKGQAAAATSADIDGKFEIQVSASAKTLVFSMLGFEHTEINIDKADKSKPLTVVMNEESKSLNEVVVIGYQDVRKRDLTVAAGQANVTDMLKAPVASFDQALAGRIAGVNVSSSEGMPGSTMNIVIRGNSSITQANSPLYIIDGFPVEDASAASSINPNDIESIDILKDASGTAIYGSRGTNGVVIITTKKGKVGDLRISYDNNFGVQRVTHKIPMMNAYEFVKLQSEIWTAADMAANSGYFATIDGKTWTLNDYRNIEQYDWQDLIFRDAMQQSHNVSLTGGTSGLRYNASVSYYDQDGVLLASNYNRIQGRFGATVRKNKLNVNISANYSQAATLGSSPSQSQYSGMNNLFYSVWGYRPVTQPSIGLQTLLDNTVDESIDQTNDYRFNPILSLKNEYRKNANTYSQYNGFAEYEFMKGLKLKVSGGYTVNSIRGETFNNSKTRYGSPVTTDKVNAQLTTSERKTWLNENVATYQKNINNIHAVSAMAGMSLQESAYAYYSMRTINIPYESLGMAGMSQGTPSTVSSLASDWSMMSYFTRVNYNYKSKYYATASFRADGSSKFAKGNRFGYFPSLSGAWTFSEENFMKPVKNILESGKLRISWGETGNNRVGEYDTYALLDVRQGSSSSDYNNISTIIHGVYPYGGNVANAGTIPTSLPNKSLKWESTAQTNVGLDLSLLN
ncbi:MAG: SusC/RagA family TonB-linked outer membrane protein, partial [Prevotella sp.]|nr:SusC/RagA family TonB-linked outer membrane protein [Prevotella sp.]